MTTPVGATQPVDWAAIGPPLVLAVAAVVVLVAGTFAPRFAWPVCRVAAIAGVGAAVAGAVALRGHHRGVFCAPPAAGQPAACSYAVDSLTLTVWAVVLFGTGVVVLLSAVLDASGRVPAGEYHFLLLGSASGALTIAAARDLVTLVVSLEVVTLPAVALTALRRRDRAGAEAGLKFFLVSVVSTAVTLMGVSFVYGTTGSMYLSRIRAALETGAGPGAVVGAGVLLTVVGLVFKVAGVPFHVWVPDTYVGAPVPVAAYLSVVSKTAGFVGLILVLARGFPEYASSWAPVFAVVAALTMTVGNLAALRQRHAVRLLAWSSVAQAGYILLPLGAAGSTSGLDGSLLTATLGYLMVYAVVNLGAFAVVGLAEAGTGARELADYAGLVRRQPVQGWALVFALVCLAGLPPGVVGLFAKLVVLRAAVDGGVGWLAVVMVVNIAIGLAYYLYFAVVCLRPGPVPPQSAEPSVSAGPVAPGGSDARTARPPVAAGLAVGVTLLAAVVLSVYPAAVLNPADHAHPAGAQAHAHALPAEHRR